MAIEHIVFDIGRVLVHWDHHAAYLDALPDEADRKRFFEEVDFPGWNLQQDAGRSWAEGEEVLAAQFPHREELIRLFRQNWHLTVPHAIGESVAIMRSLIARGYDVTLLTNWSADTYPIAQERYDFLAEPRGVTVSGQIRMVKPDPAIYAHHQKVFGLDPERTVFIDDSARNVEAAREAGWKAILFREPEELRRDLRKLGVTVD
ncbi:HAD family hydrolase [Notoacmeibacter ruber]|uniref:HAD family phosphatase n=1 Tax=Notoacmeibacter ruber TaxID=2670375 RepID=A0A3L7JAJ0_9HYPH|nr:HAD family phosphatase [Notoacmeibacter ruber]RLQ87469.1 HAD family phosphatase [Notoacmeibacter ruber]